MANQTSRTASADDRFFTLFAQTANVSAACNLSGYPRSSVYEWRRDDPEFAKRWREAEQIATENLEAEMYRRAVFGVHRSDPILWRGKIIAYKEINEYSDTLAIFLAKARDPEKYRERIDVNVNWRLEVQQLGLDPEKLLQQQIELARKQLESEAAVIDGETIELREVNEQRSAGDGSATT